MKNTKIQSLARGALAIPAAALMLGAAEASSTVALNFQSYYYDSGTIPQTVGFGGGYQTTGFPVTAKAFGVNLADWTNSDPLSSGNGGIGIPIAETIPFGGGLSASVTAANTWQSAIGEQVAGFVPQTVAPGDNEVTWGYLSSGYGANGTDGSAPSVSVSGLAAKFPDGYVVQTIASRKDVAVFDDVDITDGVTTSTVAYSTHFVKGEASDGYYSGNGTVGISAGSAPFTADTIQINPQAQTAGKYSFLAGFIITDKPVVSSCIASSSVVVTGSSFTITGTACGLGTLTYQWKRNGTNVGTNSPTYTVASASATDSGNYTLVVTSNLYPGEPATSQVASVTVHTPVTVTWDTDAGTTGAQGGDGTWDLTSANWWDGSTDNTWFDFDSAVFGGGGSDPATVTLASPVTVRGLSFNTADYTIPTGSSINLDGDVTIETQSNATIGASLDGTGILNKTGSGTLSITNKSTTTGVLNVLDGTLDLPTSPPGYWYQWTLGKSVINLSPGTALTCVGGAMGWYGNNDATGLTINIDSATCQPNGAFGVGYNLRGGSISGGGALHMGGSGGFDSFITSLASSTTSVVNPGSGVINLRTDSSQSIFTVTVADGTVPNGIDLDIQGRFADWSGPGSIVKEGPGTLQLSGLNSNGGGIVVNDGTVIVTGKTVGATTVEAGTLIVASGGQIVGTAVTINAGSLEVSGTVNAGSANVFFEDDTTFSVTANSTTPAISSTSEIAVGNYLNPGTGANTVTFSGINSETVPAVSAANLYIDKPLTINIASVVPMVGQYPLFYGSTLADTSAGAVITGTMPSGVTATIVDDTAGATGSIYLDVTAVSVPSILWTGSTNGVWDINTTNNWSPSNYQQGNIVTFDDSGNNTAITLNVAVQPGGVTFDNSTKDYTLSGTGSISGFTNLTKTGSGNLSITTNNTNNGAVSISGGGTVTAGDGGTNGSLGGSGSITLDASTLVLDRSDNQSLARSVIGTGGSLVKNGSGTLTMTSSQNTCDITINDGVLVASGGSFSNAFAPGALITVNSGATLSTPGFHSLGSSVGGGGDVPMMAINGGNWILSHEQYIRTLSMTAGTTTGVPGADGIRTLSGSVYTINPAGTSSVIGSVLNLVNAVELVVDDGLAVDDLVISGIISNGGAITKSGDGRVVLSGVNTYTGSTTVTGGTLAVNGTSIPDTNELVIDGGKVDVTADETVDTLFFGTAQQAAGTYGSLSSAAQYKSDVYFSGTAMLTVVTGPADYAAWAAINAPGQTIGEDYDNDGVPNGIEYFMGESGSGFTALPGVVNGIASWPKGASYTGVYGTDYVVQTSSDLSTWVDVDITDPLLSNGSPVEYTLPTGNPELFVRLTVTGP